MKGGEQGMNVTGQIWLELTKDERLVCLRYAAGENAKRWQKEKQPLNGSYPV